MLDLEDAPEIANDETRRHTDTGGMDDMFADLHRELQAAKAKKLTAYFAKTPTPVARVTRTASDLVLLHLVKCWNKPEEHDGGDPCAGVKPDGGHFFRCQHKNCKGLTWKDVEDVYGPLDPPPDAAKSPTINLLTCKQLDTEKFEVRYLIDNLWVEGQPGIIGGRQKTLKTTIAIDKAISLATGLPFLGRFAVNHICTTVILSGESGLPTLQETARRICASKSICLSDVDGLFWSDWVPSLDNTKHLDALERTIETTGCKLLIVDPTYLCLGAAADPGNLFAQGALLRRIGELCQRHGVGLVLLHHLRKRGKGDRSYDPPELDDLSWSGFAEFARQWLLLGRREPYQPGTGDHRLWLSAGGSAGHSGLWALDASEGVAGEPRRWEVFISTPGEAREAKQEHTKRHRLILAAREFPSGATKSDLVAQANLRNDAAINAVLAALVRDGIFETCKVSKNGTAFDGYRLAPNIAVCAS